MRNGHCHGTGNMPDQPHDPHNPHDEHQAFTQSLAAELHKLHVYLATAFTQIGECVQPHPPPALSTLKTNLLT